MEWQELKKNVFIINKKAFITTYKVTFLIIGFLIILLGILVYGGVLYDKAIDLYFLTIFFSQLIMHLFIKFKYCKKSDKVKDI